MTPKFTIVIPAYNRERELPRAIQSCLIQDYEEFELIVVDDGSTDHSYGIAAAIRDSRLRLLRHAANRGQGAARNAGALAATGDWIIFLDSDDELKPGALRIAGGIAATVADGIHRIGFGYQRDDGRVCPYPPLREQVVDYPGYLEWFEVRQEMHDFLPCTRRLTFETLRYSESLWSNEGLYMMDFAWSYRTLFRKEILGLVHTDARNRLTTRRRTVETSLAAAAECGRELDRLLDRHGDALRRLAPKTFQMFRRTRAVHHFLAGNRSDGVMKMIGCLRATPLLPEAWALLLLGVVSKSALAAVRSRRSLGL